MSKILAIFDFDNTLFDWVHVWHTCFAAMMSEVERKTGLSVEELAGEIRPVHQIHGTSEYAFLLEAIPSLQPYLNGKRASEVFGDAIRAFRSVRKRELKLYPTVAETLLKIKGSGARIAIYTESQSFYSFYRLKRLGLDGVIDRIYTPPDHDLPDRFLETGGRHYSRDYYQLRYSEHRHTPAGELKPNPDLLTQIIADFGVSKEQSVYVGDSRHKDVAMAKDAGVDYAWALYGEAQDTEAYEMLKLVTHWSDDDVEREKRIRQRDVEADVILDKSLSQVFENYNSRNIINDNTTTALSASPQRACRFGLRSVEKGCSNPGTLQRNMHEGENPICDCLGSHIVAVWDFFKRYFQARY